MKATSHQVVKNYTALRKSAYTNDGALRMATSETNSPATSLHSASFVAVLLGHSKSTSAENQTNNKRWKCSSPHFQRNIRPSDNLHNPCTGSAPVGDSLSDPVGVGSSATAAALRAAVAAAAIIFGLARPLLPS